jgi:hypothetical protein
LTVTTAIVTVATRAFFAACAAWAAGAAIALESPTASANTLASAQERGPVGPKEDLRTGLGIKDIQIYLGRRSSSLVSARAFATRKTSLEKQ